MQSEYMSIEDKLVLDRTIVIEGEIHAGVAAKVVLELLQYDAQNDQEEIQIFMAVDGANYLDVMAIYDTMNIVKSPITVNCIGGLSGYAVVILAGATHGQRHALKHSKIYLDQPYGVLGQGANQQTEITIEAKEISEQRRAFEAILSQATGQSIERIHDDCERGLELDAEQALTYGIIDHVIS